MSIDNQPLTTQQRRVNLAEQIGSGQQVEVTHCDVTFGAANIGHLHGNVPRPSSAVRAPGGQQRVGLGARPSIWRRGR